MAAIPWISSSDRGSDHQIFAAPSRAKVQSSVPDDVYARARACAACCAWGCTRRCVTMRVFSAFCWSAGFHTQMRVGPAICGSLEAYVLAVMRRMSRREATCCHKSLILCGSSQRSGRDRYAEIFSSPYKLRPNFKIDGTFVITYFRFPYASSCNSQTERAIGEVILSAC